jgi:ABC-type nickel/cobalt efflux system permease component RcnA
MAFDCPLTLAHLLLFDASWPALPADVIGSAALALPTLVVLGWGLLAGVQHALDADHLAAVSTIVSERKHWLSSSLVGGLWGVGHTLALLAAGGLMLVLRVQIGERAALALEFGVGLMLVGLGANVLWKLRRGGRLHWHEHRHGAHTHAHPHLHAGDGEHAHAPRDERRDETHHRLKLGPRPLLIGMVHGLAGSAGLMLSGLAVISSPGLGLLYIALFGLGSVGGMMVMSSLVGLPFHFTATRFARANLAARALAGLFSVGFGLFMIYEKGFIEGLFG